jgi:hypothetical protein
MLLDLDWASKYLLGTNVPGQIHTLALSEGATLWAWPTKVFGIG